MLTSTTDPKALSALLLRQEGLLSTVQARGVGLSAATLSRAARRPAGGWQRVLPRVYARFDHAPTTRDKIRAAVLYAGEGACLTGAACLHWRHVGHLPHELSALTVDVLVPRARQVASTSWVRVQRTDRAVHPISVDHLPTAPVARATLDAALRLGSYATTLGLVNAVVNGGYVTAHQLGIELILAPTRGSAFLRRVLVEMGHGTRSVAEAAARELFLLGGLPVPEINVAITVDGRVYVADFRWGIFIVEIDSQEFHLREPGSWDETQARRTALSAAGYFVLPIIPSQLAADPDAVLAGVLVHFNLLCAA